MWHVQIAECVCCWHDRALITDTLPKRNVPNFGCGIVAISPSYYAVITMVVDIVIVVETFIFSALHRTVILFTLRFFGTIHTRTHLYAQKRVFNNELAFRRTTFEEYNFEKIIHLNFITNRAIISIVVVVIGISIFIVPNQRFWLLRCQRHGDGGGSGSNNRFDFTSHHLSPYSVFTCMNLINMGQMHVRACLCPFIRYPLLFSLSNSWQTYTHAHTHS